MKRAWNYLLAEPFASIFRVFFQPSSTDLESWGSVLRCIVPIILVSYLLALLGRAILFPFHLLLHPDIGGILGDTLSSVVKGIAGVVVVIIVVNIIAALSRVVAIVGEAADDGCVFQIMSIIGAIGGSIACSIWGSNILSGGPISNMEKIELGAVFGLIGGPLVIILIGLVIGLVGLILKGFMDLMEYPVLVGIVGSVAGGIVVGIVDGITDGIVRDLAIGVVVGITGGIVLDIVRNFVVGLVVGPVACIVVGLVVGINSNNSLIVGFATGGTFIVFYLIGFFRIPVYLVSGPSLLKVYLSSHKNPSKTFSYLQHSSLHWDEIIYLPLPYLKQTLLIAYDHDPEQALKEIAFIATERSPQLRAVRAALLEITIRDIEARRSFVDIAQVEQRLDELFTPEIKLLDRQWGTLVTSLHEVSQDAAHYNSPLGNEKRLEMLGDMIKVLKGIDLHVAVRDARLSGRLSKVVNVWLTLAQQQQEKLLLLPTYIERIGDPYNPGGVLKLGDPLFFGRRDLVSQLEIGLRKGERRPTFLLTGERRIGKSSTLLQLPRLLDSSFIPAFYDLQRPGLFASTATFLGTLADGISKEMEDRKLSIEPLDYRKLLSLDPSATLGRQSQSASSERVYEYFGSWLKKIESSLELGDNIILLLFDEFEKLEEAGMEKGFDLPSLLNWFRHTIQYHPRIALLFSGVHTFSEMSQATGFSWSGYFVNVQTLRVSFLHEDEACRLVSKPRPDFPGEEVYGDGVVEQILTETGCHPFLVQAVCSALIYHLNARKKDRAELKDVSQAVEQSFTLWSNYFYDLWERTDERQRKCLDILRASRGRATQAYIQQACGLGGERIDPTLQILCNRDLIRQNDDKTYSITTPIFSDWVERGMSGIF